MSNPLKDKPVTQGIVSSIIAAPLLYYGGALLLTATTSISAYINDVPLFRAIILGVAVGMGFALMLLVISYAVKNFRATRTDPPATSTQAIESKAATKDPCSEQWLHSIAEAQRQAIQDHVHIDCWLLDFDVLHNSSLYVDLRFSFTSSCVYKLSLKRIDGRIHFANKPFQESPMVTSNEIKNVTIGKVGWLTIRQKLSAEEAAFMLHNESSFSFNQFHIELAGEPSGIESDILHINSKVSNRQILEKTPKLTMEVLETKVNSLYDREVNPGEDTPELGSVLNVRVKIQNLRPVPVEVKRLIFRVPPQRNIPAQEGQICDIALLQHGEIQQTRNPLKNLNSCPIYLDSQSEPVEGWLQFIIRDVNRRTWEMGSSGTLIAIDSRDEKHSHVFSPSLTIDRS